MERHPISPEGYEKLRTEIRQIEDVDIPAVAEKIAEARAEGDLRENAEYHGQRETMGLLQAKVKAVYFLVVGRSGQNSMAEEG